MLMIPNLWTFNFHNNYYLFFSKVIHVWMQIITYVFLHVVLKQFDTRHYITSSTATLISDEQWLDRGEGGMKIRNQTFRLAVRHSSSVGGARYNPIQKFKTENVGCGKWFSDFFSCLFLFRHFRHSSACNEMMTKTTGGMVNYVRNMRCLAMRQLVVGDFFTSFN